MNDFSPRAPLQAQAQLSAATGDMTQLLATAAAVGKPLKNPDQDGVHYAVVPDGWMLVEPPTRTVPDRPAAVVKLRDAASFIRYFNDHKVDRSRVYASLEPAKFTAVFDDFNTAQPLGDKGDFIEQVLEQADWRGYRAEFTVPASREWLLWNNANKKHMSQLSFAEFLQDNLPDVMVPDGAALLELALNFEAAQTGHFIAAQRLQDGSHNLAWKADNNASGSVRLPEAIVLNIPVFENEPSREIQARLRYRVKEGNLAIWFELVRPHKVLEQAFRDTWARIEKEAAAVVLLGSPE